MSRIQVLFIMGWARSGSTLLDRLLGEFEGFFSGGELHNVWDQELLSRRPCGCGQEVHDCEIWPAILERTLSHTESISPNDATRWRRSFDHVHLTKRILREARADTLRWPELKMYADLTARFYESISNITGAEVIVDSSKRPQLAAMLQAVPGIEPYVVHLVRDPRGVAHSWSKSRSELVRHGAVYSTTRWVVRNIAARSVTRSYGGGRFLLLRYEDLVKRPGDALRDIAALMGRSPEPWPLVSDQEVRLSGNHCLAGNPNRYLKGVVELKEDVKWRQEMGATKRLIVTTISAPLLHSYSYRLRAR